MMLDMYQDRTQLMFGTPGGPHHWNVVADPGTHAYKDCLVSLIYSWELNAGCYPKWTQLLPGKSLAPGEVDLLSCTEEARRNNKLERVSAFRQLQGLSHQINLVSGGRLTLDSFSAPELSTLRAVEHNERRILIARGGQDLHLIENTVTGDTIEVLPLSVTDVMLCNMMLDQGSPGAAGVAFASGYLCKMIEAKFDKIHRLINDLKGAERDCMGGVFSKTKFFSSYLMGLNNRPFNSGAHFTLKSRMLDMFMVGSPVEKAAFKKYMCRIAKEWSMPCDTLQDRKAILSRVSELPSFVKKLAQPKSANWFAWATQMHNHGLSDFLLLK